VSQQLGFEKYNEATLESCNCSDLRLLKKIGKFGIEEEKRKMMWFSFEFRLILAISLVILYHGWL